MSRAVLSIGSNLGDRLGHLRTAVAVFEPWLVATSGVYSTPPWGPVEQEDFLNAVLVVDDPTATPRDWLERARTAEHRAERVRELHWGPRSLDVDVIVVDDVVSDDPELTLPHRHAHERAFVLVPWLEVDPGALLGTFGSVADLVAALPADEVRAVVPAGHLRLVP